MFGRQKKSRNAVRLPTIGRAAILDTEGRPIQHCLLKQLSTTGAYITTDDPKTLPKVCEIWIPHLDLSIKATVQWRKKGEAGLEFDKPIAASQLVGSDKGWETGTILGARRQLKRRMGS